MAKSMLPDKRGNATDFKHMSHAYNMLMGLHRARSGVHQQQKRDSFWKEREEWQQRRRDENKKNAQAKAKKAKESRQAARSKQRQGENPLLSAKVSVGEVIFETVNPNAKGTLKQWLEHSLAHVVCAQEVKADREEIAELNEWCTKRGW